ncbi:hypothetical protein [Chryseobacterium sp.]|jgi:hypothetical protein|uniref:hypothetical protein n=1 Tax=Chryseobacterium sp. TaxID=1871047 RepID=UPI0026020E6A|nr:hypothetical protein [Chryseobacterium sp.]
MCFQVVAGTSQIPQLHLVLIAHKKEITACPRMKFFFFCIRSLRSVETFTDFTKLFHSPKVIIRKTFDLRLIGFINCDNVLT